MTSFNLSILECKSVSAKGKSELMQSFNLSILECKSSLLLMSFSTPSVLIYPYWNVNLLWCVTTTSLSGFNLSILECKFGKRFCPQTLLSVLIYPYWNVNSFRNITFKHAASFNLSILECKSKFALGDKYHIFGFNLSILECKSAGDTITVPRYTVLIYPYWNVNLLKFAARNRPVRF